MQESLHSECSSHALEVARKTASTHGGGRHCWVLHWAISNMKDWIHIFFPRANFCLSDVSNEGPERTNKLMQDFFQNHSNHHFNPYEADEGHGYREPVGGNMLRNALQDHLHDRFIVQPKVKSSSTNIEQSDTSNHKLLFAQFQSAFNTANESTAKDYLIVYNKVKSCLDSNDTASITRIFDFFNNDQ